MMSGEVSGLAASSNKNEQKSQKKEQKQGATATDASKLEKIQNQAMLKFFGGKTRGTGIETLMSGSGLNSGKQQATTEGKTTKGGGASRQMKKLHQSSSKQLYKH